MEIILKQDVPKLGYKGDIVKIKPGYARNYLIPQGMAQTATLSHIKMLEEDQRQASHKLAQVKENAVQLAADLENAIIEIPARMGTSGKIFGSITTLQIASALKERGFAIDRRKISLHGDIKEAGTYEAIVDLHRDIKAKINLVIIPETVA